MENEKLFNKINVWIPKQKEFQSFKKDCKELYESVQKEITDDSSFEFIINNTLFYLFEINGNLIGGIYYFIGLDGNLYVNGFAKRKIHLLCVECLKKSLTWFKGKVYAVAQNRASALCLLRCGFKRVRRKMFVINV